MYKEPFASRIKNARTEIGFSQREVEGKTGIPHSTISKYETGKLEPDLENLGKLATFYEISIDWLLGITKINGEKEKTTEEKEKYSTLKDTEKTTWKENRKAN